LGCTGVAGNQRFAAAAGKAGAASASSHRAAAQCVAVAVFDRYAVAAGNGRTRHTEANADRFTHFRRRRVDAGDAGGGVGFNKGRGHATVSRHRTGGVEHTAEATTTTRDGVDDVASLWRKGQGGDAAVGHLAVRRAEAAACARTGADGVAAGAGRATGAGTAIAAGAGPVPRAAAIQQRGRAAAAQVGGRTGQAGLAVVSAANTCHGASRKSDADAAIGGDRASSVGFARQAAAATAGRGNAKAVCGCDDKCHRRAVVNSLCCGRTHTAVGPGQRSDAVAIQGKAGADGFAAGDIAQATGGTAAVAAPGAKAVAAGWCGDAGAGGTFCYRIGRATSAATGGGAGADTDNVGRWQVDHHTGVGQGAAVVGIARLRGGQDAGADTREGERIDRYRANRTDAAGGKYHRAARGTTSGRERDRRSTQHHRRGWGESGNGLAGFGKRHIGVG